MPVSKHRAKKKKAIRRKTRVISSHWDGIWYNIADGSKARVNEIVPGKACAFKISYEFPIRTPNHLGVYLRTKDSCIICDVEFLKEKFTRIPPVKKKGDGDGERIEETSSGIE